MAAPSPTIASKPLILCVEDNEIYLRPRKAVLEQAGYAGARPENGITSLLQHGLPRTQIDLVVFYAENQGLARDCGRRSGHLQAKLLNRFRLPEQSTCRKYR